MVLLAYSFLPVEMLQTMLLVLVVSLWVLCLCCCCHCRCCGRHVVVVIVVVFVSVPVSHRELFYTHPASTLNVSMHRGHSSVGHRPTTKKQLFRSTNFLYPTKKNVTTNSPSITQAELRHTFSFIRAWTRSLPASFRTERCYAARGVKFYTFKTEFKGLTYGVLENPHKLQTFKPQQYSVLFYGVWKLVLYPNTPGHTVYLTSP